MAFATTNYDACIEVAFRRLKFQVLDGFEPTGPNGLTSPVLRPLSLAAKARESNGIVPVLHLHGGVGWYLNDGEIHRLPNELAYNPTLGQPALLLPDATKTPGSFLGGEGLWNEFAQLLRDANNVIFLGHSLNDDHVVSTVLEHSDCPVAVAWHHHPADSEDDDYDHEMDRVHQLLPHATVIRTDFGPAGTIDHEILSDWLRGDVR